MIVAWTGHRPYYFRDARQAQRTVLHLARALRREACPDLTFLTGGQRGVDLWAAEAGFGQGIPVTIVLPLPFESFTRAWPKPDAERLTRALQLAQDVEVVAESEGGAEAYAQRNRRLAAGADLLVAVWTGIQHGGTWQTITFARAAGTPIREALLPGSGRPLLTEQRGL